ncbi:MAG TPA: rod shape-determining protein RodA [Gammaproteobacteria bacterium]|nr:rod shape-determining protein RodA [Gammaproteobacteria bacterium]
MDNNHIVPFKQIYNNDPSNALHRNSLITKLHIDLPMFSCMFLCFLIGLILIYSAKLEFHLVQKQFINFLVAGVLMLIVAQAKPRAYRAWAPALYFSSLAILVLVLIIGDISKGAQRWLDLGLLRFQPAELMKLAVPLMVARTLDEHILPPSPKLLLLSLLYITVPVVLIAIQPDLGTAILVASTGIFVLFFAGISWKLIISLATLCVASTPVLWFVLRDYQRKRILTLLNPELDPLGSGYHIIQSKIAIGSGGFFGKGWLNGTQSHLEFLPERATDFIFAVLGEEFGLLGVVILLMLYMMIMLRGLYIGMRAPDTFSRLLSGSLIMTFFVYLFVNIGMVNGILPVVGIPLPLVSYGGTSLVTVMIGLGMLMSIHTHRTLVRK